MAIRYNTNILKLLDELEPAMRKAFLASIQGIKSEVQLGLLIAAIRDADVDRALRLLNLREDMFAPLDEAYRNAYGQAGILAIEKLPKLKDPNTGQKVVARFDTRNPRAEQWVRQRSSSLIVEINDEQRDNVQKVLRQGFQDGRGPRSVALDLVGRYDRTAKRRVGGIIGLTEQEIGYKENLRQVLSDPEKIRSYFVKDRKTGEWKPRFKLTDRRFDRTIVKAIRDKKALPQNVANKIVTRYEDSLLRVRGERIARTELLGATHHAEQEALEQLVDRGQLREEQIIEEWDAAEDAATRPAHAFMDGQQRRFKEPFTDGEGYQMRFPGDRSLGAPAKTIINCRCVLRKRIDYISELGPGD